MPVKRTPRAAEDNRFKPGERKVGRAKGVRNKFSRNVRDAALAAAARYGSDGRGKDGLVGFMFLLARRVCGGAGNSGHLPPPSPPAEQARGRQDQAGQTSTRGGAGNGHTRHVARDSVVETEPSRAAHRLNAIWTLLI
jgi:hypothetical protein